MDLTDRDLVGADLRGTSFAGARFERTKIDFTTRFGGCDLTGATFVSIVVDDALVDGENARSFVAQRAKVQPWTRRDLELYLLAQLPGARAAEVAAAIEPDAARRVAIAKAVGVVFDHPFHGACDVEDILGPPLARTPLAATGAFAHSMRSTWQLPLVPDAQFCVSETPTGLAWDMGFFGGGAGEAADRIEPWRWTEDRVRAVATKFEVLDHWNSDLSARVTVGGAVLEAVFGYGLLLDWIEAPDES